MLPGKKATNSQGDNIRWMDTNKRTITIKAMELMRKKQATATTTLNFMSNPAKSLDYSTETKIDYGYGNIDFVWNVSLHSSLPQIKWGFVKLKLQEGGNRDWQDNHILKGR